jgi:hypothetical protein
VPGRVQAVQVTCGVMPCLFCCIEWCHVQEITHVVQHVHALFVAACQQVSTSRGGVVRRRGDGAHMCYWWQQQTETEYCNTR